MVARDLTEEEILQREKTIQIIYFILGGVNFMLLLRLLFRAFGANAASPIVSLTYSFTGVLLAPFRGIFEVAAAGESVIEPSILVAILIYSVLARAVTEVIYLLSSKE